jgi:hypothetical protein
MANTYTLIESQVLGSAAPSVTFSSIPATYTDLVLKVSARGSVASTQSNLAVELNSDASALYSAIFLFMTGATPYSQGWTGDTYARTYGNTVGSTATANTFSSFELYLPSYTASQNKPLSTFGVTENNSASNATITATANLYRSTAAISAIRFFNNDSSNFVADSSFNLYGISNTI